MIGQMDCILYAKLICIFLLLGDIEYSLILLYGLLMALNPEKEWLKLKDGKELFLLSGELNT